MNQQKNVLFFTDKISYSGASKIIAWLVNNISLPDTKILLATYLNHVDSRKIESHVVRIKLNTKKSGKIQRCMDVIRQLRKIILENKCEICVGFLPIECLYLQIAALGTNTPVIVCERSDPYMEKSVAANIGRFCFRFASGAIFQTDGAKAYFPKMLQKKSIVIANPVFKTGVQYVPYNERENLIGYSGRLYIRQKRQDVLLQAFARVCEKDHTVKLILLGDGPDEEKLKVLARDLKIYDRVIFAGSVSNTEEHVAKCKVFAFSSDYEGIPNSILEALQVGVPVVSTDCSPGGARMLIQNGENGFVVARQDVDEMAECMLWLLENKLEAERFAENAMLVYDKFREDRIIEEWRNYLRRYL